MQQFRPDDGSKMTDAEAQEVLRLLAERRREREDLDSMPSVQDVAQLASASPEEVASALAAVRAFEAAPKEVTTPRARPGFFLAISVVVIAALVFLAFMVFTTVAPAPMPPPVPGQPVPLPPDSAIDVDAGTPR